VTGPIVVDVGNSRIKWGRCEGRHVVEMAALPPDAPTAWQQQFERWNAALAPCWCVSGVHPQRRDMLLAWLRERAMRVHVLDSCTQLPLEVQVKAREKVGIDRLLNAVAANTRRLPQIAAVIVDAGSAVTVDYVDTRGVFRGGAIFPGLRLMSQALHAYTAMLPVVEIDGAEPPPGTSTEQAIRVGVFHALVGGVRELICRYMKVENPPGGGWTVFLTGGDGAMLKSAFDAFAAEASAATPIYHVSGNLWPEMTLEGILHSVPDLAAHD
jgi:type III pantothenate kinase